MDVSRTSGTQGVSTTTPPASKTTSPSQPQSGGSGPLGSDTISLSKGGGGGGGNQMVALSADQAKQLGMAEGTMVPASEV